MTIQDKIQKIHLRYGTSEKANRKIGNLFLKCLDRQRILLDEEAVEFAEAMFKMPNSMAESKTFKEHQRNFKMAKILENVFRAH